jgi:hypothetical protein
MLGQSPKAAAGKICGERHPDPLLPQPRSAALCPKG